MLFRNHATKNSFVFCIAFYQEEIITSSVCHENRKAARVHEELKPRCVKPGAILAYFHHWRNILRNLLLVGLEDAGLPHPLQGLQSKIKNSDIKEVKIEVLDRNWHQASVWDGEEGWIVIIIWILLHRNCVRRASL